MSNTPNNRYAITRRHGRTWGWLTVGAVLVLVAVGTLFATGRWDEDATRTGRGAPSTQVSSGMGATEPGVPNQKTR